MDLNEKEETFREMGVSVDSLRRYISRHNDEIIRIGKQAGVSDGMIKQLTSKPMLSDPGTRRKRRDRIPALPNVFCECGHSWPSRSRTGKPVVRCHKCGACVKVASAGGRK